ncbi:hypothetical protein ACFSN5_05330 [Streptococcus tangpeifui]|uniref:hypothetical protein n=1 Tax=Streptococcus tangpeifui TaxID=2709400 RepID=UPI0013E9CEFD|nr:MULTISPECIES: hypothetical protein [unclassified Streptococcus]
MDKEDWITLFKEVNGRDPEAQEIEAAIRNGVIDQVPEEAKPAPEPTPQISNNHSFQKETTAGQRPAPQSSATPVKSAAEEKSAEVGQEQQNLIQTSPTKSQQTQPRFAKQKILKVGLISLACLFLALILALAGYGTWRYQSGNISGTWKLEKKVVYSSGDKIKLVQGNANSTTQANVAYKEYLTVDRARNLYTFAYLQDKQDKDSVGLPITNYFQNSLKANYWKKTIRTTYSKKEAKKMVVKSYNRFFSRIGVKETLKIRDLSYFDTDRDLQERFAYTYSYQVKGDTLTLVARDKKGKKVETLTYRKLSKKGTEDFHKQLKSVRLKFEKNMKKQYN